MIIFMSQAMKLAEQASASVGQRGLVGIGKVSELCELTKLETEWGDNIAILLLFLQKFIRLEGCDATATGGYNCLSELRTLDISGGKNSGNVGVAAIRSS